MVGPAPYPPSTPVAPFRRAFDVAASPYAARNALGIPEGGGAPASAEYITSSANATLTAERVLTNTATVTWDFSTAGQAKANAATSGGNVSNSGTPSVGQYAKWVTATTIQGVAPATVLSDIGAQPAGSYQPLDTQLTALAGVAGGVDQLPYFTSTSAAAQTTLTSFARTALDDPDAATMLMTLGALSSATAAATYQPLDADLTAIAALTGTNTIYYRSAANIWSGVTIGAGLTFTGGSLAASGGGSPGTDFRLTNLGLAITAASNALTIALKDASGADPSSGSPVTIDFRSATLATGAPSTVSVQAATSVVLASGNTMGVTSAKAFRLWIVAFNNGGTVELGAINCSTVSATAATIFPLNEAALQTSLVSSANRAVGEFATTTARSSLPIRILGYVEWGASGLTAGTWTTTNLLAIQLFGPGIRKPGDIVQTKSDSSVSNSSTTSTTYVVTPKAVAIIPTSAANPIRVHGSGLMVPPASDACFTQISRGQVANTNMIGSVADTNGAVVATGVMNADDLPNIASSQAYAIQIRSAVGGNANFSNGQNTYLSVTEIMG